MKKLSPVQIEVMKWLGKKWSAQPSHGELWTINGGSARQGVTCTTRTLSALEKYGLAVTDEHGCWVATDAGKAFVRDMAI
jgi:hypothetical protein